jgi:hypothetical protein
VPFAPDAAPVVEAGTFRIDDGGDLPSFDEMVHDVQAINDPGLDQRQKSARQQTIDGFLRSLQEQAPSPNPKAGYDKPLPPVAPARPQPQKAPVDPFHVVEDVAELTSPAAAPVRSAANEATRSAPDLDESPTQALAPSRPEEPSAAPPTPPASRPWSDFFHFPAGTEFKVDGPLSYNGSGTVVELADKSITLEIHMPEETVLGRPIPQANLVISVAYAHEGSGNTATIEANGKRIEETNLTIHTDGGRRRLTPSVSIPGIQLGEISVAQAGEVEIDLKITIDDRTWDFDLKRKSS